MNIFDFIKNEFNEDSVIFEIGCHMGLDTEKIKEITNCRQYHCFECDPRNIEIIKKQKLDIILNECAVSDLDGEVELYQSTGKPPVTFQEHILNENDWTASSSIKRPKEHLVVTPWCQFTEPIKVNSVRVDSYIEINKLTKIDFIWMDVQGAEIEVLNGLGKSKECVSYIFTEYSEKELYEDGKAGKEDILRILGKDWEIVHDFGTDILLKNKKI